MEIDPLETKERADEHHAHSPHRHRQHRVSSLVAITIALLATFMGVCKVKSDNIARAMQMAQTDRVDNWNWYQARNIRQEILSSSAAQLQTQLLAAPASAQAGYQKQIADFTKHAKDQKEKMAKIQITAEEAGKRYEKLNFHHDQFDIAETALTVAISVLAITALTGAAWLYYLALLPAACGIIMGIAGLSYSSLNIEALAKFLGA